MRKVGTLSSSQRLNKKNQRVNCEEAERGSNSSAVGLTPAHGAELEDVSAYVGVEDFHQSDVHVNGLQAHPGEGGEQEVVQEDGGRHAQPLAPAQVGQPAVQQEHHVEEEQRRAQVHQDLRRVVAPQVPAGGKSPALASAV